MTNDVICSDRLLKLNRLALEVPPQEQLRVLERRLCVRFIRRNCNT